MFDIARGVDSRERLMKFRLQMNRRKPIVSILMVTSLADANGLRTLTPLKSCSLLGMYLLGMSSAKPSPVYGTKPAEVVFLCECEPAVWTRVQR